MILYKFWEWQLDLQKIETRQNEQRHEGLIWFHVIEDHTQPDLVENNNSKITVVDVARFSFYLPSVSFVLSLRLHFWQLSETKKWLSWICDLIGFIEVNIAFWLKKLFVEVALDTNKFWPVCFYFIPFKKVTWWWSLVVAAFVLFGFERTSMCLWDCLWRDLGIRRIPKIFSSLLLCSD